MHPLLAQGGVLRRSSDVVLVGFMVAVVVVVALGARAVAHTPPGGTFFQNVECQPTTDGLCATFLDHGPLLELYTGSNPHRWVLNFDVNGAGTGTLSNCTENVGHRYRGFGSDGEWVGEWVGDETGGTTACRTSASPGHAGVFSSVIAMPLATTYGVEVQTFRISDAAVLARSRSTGEFEAPVEAPVLSLTSSTVSGGVGSNVFTWTAPAGADAHELQRQKCGETDCTEAFVERYAGAELGFDDQAGPQIIYVYRVRATNENGAGPWSDVVAVVTGDGLVEELHGGDAEDPDNDAACGLSVFCYIKAALSWAFVPPEGTWDAWDGIYADMQVTPPFSIGISGGTFIFDFIDNIWGRYNSFDQQPWCLDGFIPDPGDPTDTLDQPACLSGPFAELAASTSYVGILRWLAGMFTMFAASVRVWNILKSGFGGGPSDPGEANILTDDEARAKSMGTGGDW